MSRSSFTRRFSFNSGRKNSRETKQRPQSDPQKSLTHNSISLDSPAHTQHLQHHHSLLEKRQHSRRENSDAEKVARGIFGDVPLTDTERRFLSAAETGHLAALEQCVEDNGTLNVNCRDYLGRTALQLGVIGEHYECLAYLLEKSSLDTIEEALLHAIKTQNVKICDMILGHPMYSDKSARMQLEFQHGFYNQEDGSSSFAPDITPIVLAAQTNNFDIVHMLIQKGFVIHRPHHYFCFCTECSNHKTFDRFVHSRSRLNAYRGLASTAYLSLSCDDPILTAFELSKSLYTLAETEKEYKSEYRALSETCKSYAVDLLDLCRSNEEVIAALHGGSNIRDLSRIRMAIRYEQKKFIAHASCQEHLMSMWYSGVPWFQHQPFTMKLFLLPLGIMFIPVTAMVYVFVPYSKVGEVLRSPFMKFVNYICSYTAFLVLLFFTTALTSTNSVDLFAGTEGVVHSLIMFYVIGMFWAECKQLWGEGVKGYFSQMWNYMDITMLSLYTAAYAIEAVIYTKVTLVYTRLPQSKGDISMGGEDDGIPDPQILSRVLFSVANVMSFARIAYILPASETFGQLQISYGRMLQDVGKFIFIYFTVMIAFICGLTSLYSLSSKHNEHFSKTEKFRKQPGDVLQTPMPDKLHLNFQTENTVQFNLIQTTGTLFWAAFGMGNSAAPQIEKGGRHNMVELVGYILYGVYILGAVVVLINMLIAMMSNTFEEIQTCEDVEWKFARAKLWISFIEEGTTLPIPFNIVPTPKSIVKFVAFTKNFFLDCSKDAVPTDDQDGGFSIDYKAIMHKVVLRYVHRMKFDKKGDFLKEDLLDAKEEILAQAYNMNTALHVRLDNLERQLLSLGANPYAKADDISLASNPLVTPSSTLSFSMPTTATTTTTAAAASTATSTTTCNSVQTNVTVSRPSPSPSPQNGHRVLAGTQSVPGRVGVDSARLATSFYEPRPREFVSRRWSYYHHDRSRGRRGGGGQRPPREESESQQQQQQQLQQQQQAQQQRQYQQQSRAGQQQSRGDHSPVRQPDRAVESSVPSRQRGRSRSDYSPVRYQERGDYSPVRLQENGNRSPSGEGGLKRHGTMQTRHQSLRRQNSVHQQPAEPQASSPRVQTRVSLHRQPAARPPPCPSSPTSPAASPRPLSRGSPPPPLSPGHEPPILRPDLTPTRTQTLRREFSRTERHSKGGGGGGRGSRSPSLGPGDRGGAGRGTAPRSSPTASSASSPRQPSPQFLRQQQQQQQQQDVMAMVMPDRQHARTQSLHREQTGSSTASAGSSSGLPTQRSKEV